MVDRDSCWYHIDTGKQKVAMNVKVSEVYAEAIKSLVDCIPDSENTLIDIGCGTGKASKTLQKYDYTGADLPDMIDDISKQVNPGLKFIKCDIIEDDISFISDYNIIYMDALIDIMQHPLKVLDCILDKCSKYVLLIRQEMVDGETKVIQNPAYTGFTYHSEIGRDDFNDILAKHNVSIVKEVDAGIGIWKNTRKQIKYDGEWRSFLLCKKYY